MQSLSTKSLFTLQTETLEQRSLRYAKESNTVEEYEKALANGYYMIVFLDKTPCECTYIDGNKYQDALKFTQFRSHENTEFIFLSDITAKSLFDISSRKLISIVPGIKDNFILSQSELDSISNGQIVKTFEL